MIKKVTAVGYGRFSSAENQNASSTQDQGDNIREYARSRGMNLITYYSDDGITGATLQRPGLQAMIRDVEDGRAKIVIIEDIDRLGRDEEHLQYLKKLFSRNDVALHTLSGGGPIDDLVFSFKGIMSEHHRKKIAYWSRRGLVGKAARGGFTGGRTLGYVREITGIRGDGTTEDRYAIDPAGAELVRYIFEMYADGLSLTSICALLDEAGVPTPSAGTRRRKTTEGWSPSTLSGNIERGEGILNNRLYIGERIFNRRHYIEQPDGKGGFKRRPRDNDPSLLKITAVPEARIVSDELWQRVKTRQAEARAARDAKFKITGNPLAGAKRPTYLLSDLVHCGECGSNYIASGNGRWRCRRNFRKGPCPNNRSVKTTELEDRVLAGVRDRLLRPDLIERYARLLQKEIEQANRERDSDRDRALGDLGDIRAKIAKLIQRIEEDDDAPKSLVRRLKELEAEEETLAAAAASAPATNVVRLPANYAAIYKQAIAELQAHLAGEEASYARDTIRALIEKVVIRPSEHRQGPIAMELHGDLFRMLEFATAAAKPGSRNDNSPRLVAGGCMTPVVAGVGFEPTTFRL